MLTSKILLAAISFTALAHASSRYVSATGNDTNNGSLAAPFRTIQHAVTVSRAGDTVYVRAGSYRELVTFTASGSATLGPITLQNYPGETTFWMAQDCQFPVASTG
ncbi:MAG: hypothetical protein NVSMB52_06700 [Chloroflexota bacterium]